MDEVPQPILSQGLNKIVAKGLWISLRTTNPEKDGFYEEQIKKDNPEWLIHKFVYPLRTSKQISENLKRKGSETSLSSLQYISSHVNHANNGTFQYLISNQNGY